MSTVQKISFAEVPFQRQSEAERHRRRRAFLEDVSGMSDEEITEASFKNANNRVKDSNAARALNNGTYVFYAATSLVCGALTKGGLSNKVMATAGALGLCAFINAAAKPVGRAVDAIMDSGSKDSEKKNSEEHPVLSTMLSAAALIGVSTLALKGANKGIGALAKKFEPAAKELGEKFVKHTNNLDNSKLGKFTSGISEKAAEFSKKHPKVSSFAANSAIFAPLVAVTGASVPLSAKVANDRDEIALNNIVKLALCRDAASFELEKEDLKNNSFAAEA
ncbi:MAG: hypothetical protein LUE64_04215 [Candidatus Gastranaerophilales bacterium]|nr:hypothetical protein [Candidatus Gastranaerophilales bacterium]